MRIVGGDWRGRPIAAPEGRDTRPTIDRVRESIASIVLARTGALDEASVLDAFAGSGALALEMLSRGAAHATLYDRDPKALACIRANVERLGVPTARVDVMRADVVQAATRGRVKGAPFDLVLLDPPYAMAAAQVGALLTALAERGALREGCVVIYERDAHGLPLDVPGLVPTGTKVYGTTAVDALSWRGAEAQEGDAASQGVSAPLGEMASVAQEGDRDDER